MRRIGISLVTALLVVLGTLVGLASPSGGAAAGSVGGRLAVGLVVAVLFGVAGAALDKLAEKRRSLLH